MSLLDQSRALTHVQGLTPSGNQLMVPHPLEGPPNPDVLLALLARNKALEGESCKKRWKNIKDTYYRQKRKNKSGTGSAAPKNPRSKFQTYERLLTFLQLVPNERSTETNIEDSDATQDSQTCDQASESVSSLNDQKHLGPVSSTEETRDDGEHDTVNVQTPSRTSSCPNSVFPKSNRKRTHQKKDEILAFLQNREESRQKVLETLGNKNVEDSELAMFSEYVKSVLQKLPSNLKINAKKEIFDVLLKYESLNVPASTNVVHVYSPQPTLASTQPSTSCVQTTDMELELHQPQLEAADFTFIRL